MKKEHKIISGIIILFVISQLVIMNIKHNQEMKRIQTEKEAEISIIKMKTIAEEVKEKRRQDNIDECILSEYRSYQDEWDRTCELVGKEDSCSLATYRADKINESHAKKKENCYKRFEK